MRKLYLVVINFVIKSGFEIFDIDDDRDFLL